MEFGFAPNTELTELAGYLHEYVHDVGGWVPRTDRMETTVPGVFAAGDGAGVAGVLVAVEEVSIERAIDGALRRTPCRLRSERLRADQSAASREASYPLEPFPLSRFAPQPCWGSRLRCGVAKSLP